MKLCSFCKEKPVKLAKNDTCSRTCAGLKRWRWMKQTGRFRDFKLAEAAAKKTRHAMRLREEIGREMAKLKLKYDPIIAKLYVRARNNGYHSGYYTGRSRSR